MAFALIALAIVALGFLPFPRTQLAALDGPPIADTRIWGYQLQRALSGQINSDVDLLVLDYSRDGTESQAFSTEQVAQFRTRSGAEGGASGTRPRRVLAYMSIGEAESYRYYWSPLWSVKTPAWLGPENATWKRNYLVKFWHRNWQQVILSPRPSALRRLVELQLTWQKPYIDRIIEAGFDGVYLDRVDAFEAWAGEHPSAERDMVEFVKRISAYAKSRRPGFLVVPQNAEELLLHADYIAAIDAVAKEDVLYGIDGDERRNSEDDVQSTFTFLDKARAANLPVFVVEYLRTAERRFEADARLRARGFTPLFTTRQLNQPPEAQATQVAPTAPVVPRN